jgi:hypothetical protein
MLCLHDEGSMFLKNVGRFVRYYTASCPRSTYRARGEKLNFGNVWNVFHCSKCIVCGGLNVSYRIFDGWHQCFGGKCLHFYPSIRNYFPKFPNLEVSVQESRISYPNYALTFPELDSSFVPQGPSKVTCYVSQNWVHIWLNIILAHKGVQSKTKRQHTGNWSATVTALSPVLSSNSILPPRLFHRASVPLKEIISVC